MKRITLLPVLALLALAPACNRDPKVVSAKYVVDGNRYYDKGQFKEASIMYRRALQKYMRNGDAHYRLGLVELKQNMLGESLHSFRSASDIDPNNMEALVKIGEIDLIFYNYDPIYYKSYMDDLRFYTKKILDKDSKSFDGLRLSGFIKSLGDKDLDGAVKLFEQANQVKPDQPDLILALVRTLTQAKRPEDAERAAKDLLSKRKDFGPMYDYLYVRYVTSNRPSDAEEVLKQKVANNPNNGQYRIQLALHYAMTNRRDEVNQAVAPLADQKIFPDGRMLAGSFFMRINDLDRALTEFREGEKTDSKNRGFYRKHEVEILARQGKVAEATQVMAVLMKDDPKDTETVSMHAALLVQTKDPKQVQKAIDELTPLIATTPSNQAGALQSLHFNLAQAYKAKGDQASREQARIQLKEVLKINKDHLPAKLLLMDLMLGRNENNEAVQLAEEIIAKSPNNVVARLGRTAGWIGMGENTRARAELNMILQSNPKLNEARYQLARLDFSEKHFKEAESSFDILNKQNDTRGFFGVINCKMQLGELPAAIQMLRDQIKQSPDRLEFHRAMAEVETAAKQYDDAIGEYKTIVQKDPQPINYLRLGDIEQRAGQIEPALASYQKAREMLPRDPFPILKIAILYDITGHGEECRKAYEEVLTLDPGNAQALNNIAFSKADQGVDLDQALTYAQRAQQKLPNDLDVNDTIGLIYLRKNLIEDSVRVLSSLVAQAPDRATYHLHYAMALYQKGDKLTAKKELDQATRLAPSDKEKLRIQELRQKLS